jgi:alkylresorcinol/alkylpyrone synthase
MRITAVGKAFPPHYYSQEELLEAFKRVWGGRIFNQDRLESLHKNVLVGGRHLALPMEEYEKQITTWGAANDAWIEVAQEVGEAAIRDALARADLSVDDVGCLIFVSVTGVATPSIDARLMNRLEMPAGVRRLPIFGLGCVAGAAGISRAADYVKAYPDQVAVLLSVELCSLTLQLQDLSIPNLISSGLFGDGAAAVVLEGDKRSGTGPRVLASQSIFYRDTERVMGWDISEKGFQVVLSAAVPEVVRDRLRPDVDRFLAEQDLNRGDITSWIAHPGGPRVLEAMQEALEVPREALEITWRSLREVGNLSSTSVLLVLEETMANRRPEPGSLGMLLALGPGFCSELVLLQW